MKKKCLVVLMLTWLCIQGFGLTSPVSGEEFEEYQETIEASVFISIHPGELRLVKNIKLIFENIDPPINTSITAFNDRFLELEFTEMPRGDHYSIDFNVYFEPNLENETAKFYANEIISEFMKVFGYSGLNLLWENQMVREGRMWVYKSFGYILLTKENALTFLKFAPKNGFGKFIENLIEKYVPGDSTTGLINRYFIKKVDSKFYCDVIISGASSDLLPSWEPHDYRYTLSLKELLNSDSPIVDQPLEYQQIIVAYEENHTELLSRGWTTYTIDVESVQPEGYTVTPDPWPNRKDIKYKPLFPMENIIVSFTINSYVRRESQIPPWIWPAIGIIILLAALIVLLCIAKKRKGGEAPWEKSPLQTEIFEPMALPIYRNRTS